MLTYFLLASALQLPVQQDLDEVRADARRAESRYERIARMRAPIVGWGRGGSDCDEIVGRFCLTYDDGVPQPPPEAPAVVVSARRGAIEALREVFARAPGERATAGPLVRLLVEDDRAAEAVAAALTFKALSGDSVWGPLLTGFALHAAGEIGAAETEFRTALPRLAPKDRAQVDAVDWLLAPAERGRWRRLDEEERARQVERAWSWAQPLYLLPGNERWTEHVARWVWSRLLAPVSVARDQLSWGRDMEELVMRFGTSRARGRVRSGYFGETSMVDYYEDEQLDFFPERMLSDGLTPQPPPGSSWRLDAPRPRSGYALRSVRRLLPLAHQVTRFPTPDGWRVRVDAQFALDSLARRPPEPPPGDTTSQPAPVPGPVDVGLFLLDSTLIVIDSSRARVVLEGDSVRFSRTLATTYGTVVYSAEAYEAETRTAARSRYTLDLAPPFGGRVSDVLLAEPVGMSTPSSADELRADLDLIVALNDTVGLYAEALPDRAGDVDIEVALRRIDRGSLPGRLARWLGRSVGLIADDSPPRVRWQTTWDGDGPLRIALDLIVRDVEPGLHNIEITTQDARGRRATGRRLILVREADGTVAANGQREE